ncbi:Os04g0182850, partial [Oryza sativa Japonica Group]
MFAAAAIAGPVLDPHGSAESTYGFCGRHTCARTHTNTAEVGPLGEVGLAEHDGAGAPQPGHHAGVAPGDRAEQRQRPGRRVEPVARRDDVLEEDGHAVERAATVAGGALGVGARRLGERVGVDLDDGVEERVEAGDAVEVEADERRGGEAAVAEAELDGVDGGLMELEAERAAAGERDSCDDDDDERGLPSHGV